MGFFSTLATGYQIMWSEAKIGWQKHGAQFLTGGGTALMLLANGLFARKAAKEDTQKAIAEAEAVIRKIEAEIVTPKAGETEKQAANHKKYRLMKAKGRKALVYVRRYWKEATVSLAGAGMVGFGCKMEEDQKTVLATGLAGLGAEFAAYRANVRADLGAEKDQEYMSKKIGQGGVIKKGKAEVVDQDGYSVEDDGITVQADPSAFKLHISPELTPWICSDNLYMRRSQLENIERDIELIAWKNNGLISLNDMRRQCASLNNPRMFDHGLGGIFGKRLKSYRDADGHVKYPHFQLGGWREDLDFYEGRKTDVWIIFPCDPEPIINDINKKLLVIEERNC